jgi:diphthamide synthase (EF-2-diphthine--ammonia ligase)
MLLVGDILFDSQRRMLQRLAARHNISSYGYLFTDPQPGIPAMYGGMQLSDK